MALHRLEEMEDWDGDDFIKLCDLETDQGKTAEVKAVVTEMAKKMKTKIEDSERKAKERESHMLPDEDELDGMFKEWTIPLRRILEDEMGDAGMKEMVQTEIDKIEKKYFELVHAKWGANGGGEGTVEMVCATGCDLK